MDSNLDSMSKRDYETLATFRYRLRRFLRVSEEAAYKAGVTPQQYQAMLAVKGLPEGEQMTVGELAERLQIRPHSAVGLVDRLEAQSLVRRETDREVDKRRVYVKLTEKGMDVLAQIAFAGTQELRTSGPELTSLLQLIGQHDASKTGRSRQKKRE